jgi:hypothetical protein
MKLGPRPNGRPWTPAEDAQLATKFENGKAFDLRKLKRTVTAISKRLTVLRAAGVKVRK